MGRMVRFRLLLVAAVTLVTGSPALAADGKVRSTVDAYALYTRLSPGMSLGEVRELAGGQLATAQDTVTTWLLWSPMPEGGTAVLRTAFQDGRVIRLEYESFGAEYRRLVKGGDPWIEIPGDELARIWRQTWRVEQAAESCRDALDAYHHVVLDSQERLTAEQQQAWARALLLRRTAEERLLLNVR